MPKLDIDYSTLGRGTSFVLLLLVLFAISSSLSILVDLVSTDGAGSKGMRSSRQDSSPSQYESPAHLLACPQRDTHETKWGAEEGFMEWSPEVTEKWRNMLPDNNGLGQDDSFNEGKAYGIAMFHQIHCMYAIREHYTILLGGPDVPQEDIEHVKSFGEMMHIAHCFDWVRQVCPCNASPICSVDLY